MANPTKQLAKKESLTPVTNKNEGDKTSLSLNPPNFNPTSGSIQKKEKSDKAPPNLSEKEQAAVEAASKATNLEAKPVDKMIAAAECIFRLAEQYLPVESNLINRVNYEGGVSGIQVNPSKDKTSLNIAVGNDFLSKITPQNLKSQVTTMKAAIKAKAAGLKSKPLEDEGGGIEEIKEIENTPLDKFDIDTPEPEETQETAPGLDKASMEMLVKMKGELSELRVQILEMLKEYNGAKEGSKKFHEIAPKHMLEVSRKLAAKTSAKKGSLRKFTTCIEFAKRFLAKAMAELYGPEVGKKFGESRNSFKYYGHNVRKTARKLGCWTDGEVGGTSRPKPADIMIIGKTPTKFSHICYVLSVKKLAGGKELWRTMDGGQGGAGVYSATIKDLGDKKEEVTYKKEVSGSEMFKESDRIYDPKTNILEGRNPNGSQDQRPRHVWGWADLDKLLAPEIKDKKMKG